MGAIGPEVGDAAVVVVVGRKRPSKTIDFDLNERHDDSLKISGASSLLNILSKTSLSVVNKALINPTDSLETGIPSKSNNTLEYGMENCGFPYYRSCTSDRGPYDAVLVKDVGVSCTITDKDSKNSILENYLLDRLKTEYSDLSTITKKISSYTKDILQSLSSRSKGMARSIRKNIRQPEAGNSGEKSKFLQKLTSESTSIPVALQCSDQNGNPCLKLRLKEPLRPVPKRRSISRNDTLVNRFLNPSTTKPTNSPKNSTGDSKRNIGNNRVLVLRQDESTCGPVKSVKKIFPKEPEKAEVDSSGCSSSSIYNFLMSGKRKSWQKGRSIKPASCLEENSEIFDPGMMEDDEALREQYRILVPSGTKEKLSATKKISKDPWSETFHAVNIRIIKRAPKDAVNLSSSP